MFKKKKTKQKNTLRAITDNADSKRERDKKLGPNLNYFFNETTSEQVVVIIIICYKKTKTKKRKSVIMLQKKKNRNQSNLTWGI